MAVPTKLDNTIKALPDKPGIYLYYDEAGELIYVGKATSLRSRVRSYFVGKRTSRPIEALVHEIKSIKHKETESALEAAILESVYIKQHLPKYNVLGKDNKSWNYIVITREDYPQVKTMRQHTLSQYSDKEQRDQFLYVFGPFPGLNGKATLKILRKLFLFSTCQKYKKKNTSSLRGGTTKQSSDGKKRSGSSDNEIAAASAALQPRNDEVRPCLYYQMGECLGVCTGEISIRDYKSMVITPLATFLRGNKKSVIKSFEKRMKVAAKTEQYEEAARLRDQVFNLQKIYDVTMINESFVQDAFAKPGDGGVVRIEGYDISNFGNASSVASMVVFSARGGSALGGEYGPVKSEYRRFRVKTVEGQSDVDSLHEVMSRRLARSYDTPSLSLRAERSVARQSSGSEKKDGSFDKEIATSLLRTPRNDSEKKPWPKPDVLLIDGGRPQINRVQRVLDEFQVQLPIVGIAKGADRKKNEFIFPESAPRAFIRWVADHQRLLIQVRDEAHRFALAYQKQTRKIQKKTGNRKQ